MKELAMSEIIWSLCFFLLLHVTSADVFLQSQDASEVLKRLKRANSPFEEWRQGDMERECIEEVCNHEEAREIFEDDVKTEAFWNVYFDGDACLSTPCLNGGKCKDGIGNYNCFCQPEYHGYNCEFAIPQLCENKNGGCDHFCNVIDGTVQCSCAKGYELVNGKKCHSDDPFKCGVIIKGSGKETRTTFRRDPDLDNNTTLNTLESTTQQHNDTHALTPTVESIFDGTSTPSPTEFFDPFGDYVMPEEGGDTRVVGGSNCDPGECPWQALLVNEEGMGFCGGTILNEYFVLSAAHCMNQSTHISVVLGEFDMNRDEGREARHEVQLYITHKHYIPATYHNDIALIKLKTPIKFTKFIVPACLPDREFAESVLMKQSQAMISGFGRVREGGPQSTTLQKLTVPYVDRATCIDSSSFKVSKHMFCAGYDKENMDACQGDSGGPHVTKYGTDPGTWFVTGVVSWGEGCAKAGKYGVYTQVSKFITWVNGVMENVMKLDLSNSKRKRDVLPRHMIGITMVLGSLRWNILLYGFLLSNFQPTRAAKPVFQTQVQATVFLRTRRDNSYLFEEFFQGNLEKECMEETCTKEEARECFEDDVKTEVFWAKYIELKTKSSVQENKVISTQRHGQDGDQCTPNPCQNGGTCTDKVGGYNCTCAEFHVGARCETDISQCPLSGPYACEHFCSPTYGSYKCHCVQGYTLHTDGKSCRSRVRHPCGRIQLSTNTPTQSDSLPGNEICPDGQCPWQVTLMDKDGEAVCNGVILGLRAVLTTATCMSSPTDITHVQIGQQSAGSKGVIKVPLHAVPTIHKRYEPGEQEYDLCFLHLKSSLPLGESAMPLCLPEKDFSENVLMQEGLEGVVSPEHARHFYLPLADCRDHLNVSFPLTNKMFCMKEHVLIPANETSKKERGVPRLIKEEEPKPTIEVQVGPPSLSITRAAQGLRPRTQQTVWVNEPEEMEDTEPIEIPDDFLDTPLQAVTLAPLNKIQAVNKSHMPKPKPTAGNVVASGTETSKTRGFSPTVAPEKEVATESKRETNCGPLSGTPVASVKGKTAFVTGLMLSHDCSEGLVFTKLSRFLPWIEDLLEDTMKPPEPRHRRTGKK
ncbi:uncharacterized protein LOC134459536 [Engraulis encrasicolus]|uniref:uncharacterized protein LOC134459536 n=1 Tax=Engraulis encrasicolus TaxID=184585 RepID=UPI002FD35403